MTTQIKPTWILVARRSGATIYLNRGSAEPLAVLREIDHPSGRLRAKELETDRPGRAFDRGGQGRHAMTSEQDPTEHIEERFAAELARDLDHARHQGELGELVLIAGPKLLGYLRAALTEPTRKLVIREVAKDLVDPSPAEVLAYLRD